MALKKWSAIRIERYFNSEDSSKVNQVVLEDFIKVSDLEDALDYRPLCIEHLKIRNENCHECGRMEEFISIIERLLGRHHDNPNKKEILGLPEKEYADTGERVVKKPQVQQATSESRLGKSI